MIHLPLLPLQPSLLPPCHSVSDLKKKRTQCLAPSGGGRAAGVAAGTLDDDLARDTRKRAEKRGEGGRTEFKGWTDGGYGKIEGWREGGRERDNDDETSAGAEYSYWLDESETDWAERIMEGEKESVMDRGDGWQMGRPQLLTADHSLFLTVGFLSKKLWQRGTFTFSLILDLVGTSGGGLSPPIGYSSTELLYLTIICHLRTSSLSYFCFCLFQCTKMASIPVVTDIFGHTEAAKTAVHTV